jgi:hypothetical protein
LGAARVLGVVFGLAGLYYVSFYLLRHEPTTIVQAAALFAAAAFLAFQQRPAAVERAWFRPSGLPTSWPGWAAIAGLGLAAAAVFVLLDQSSHSASDTITRSLPTLSLIAALAVKIVIDHRQADIA